MKIKIFEEFSDEYYKSTSWPRTEYTYQEAPNQDYKPTMLTKIKKFFGKEDTNPNRNIRIGNLDFSNQENFTSREIEEIKKYLPNIKFQVISGGNDHGQHVKSSLSTTIPGVDSGHKYDGHKLKFRHQITITKYKDEYYYLSIGEDVYKCDQLEGLIECLKEKLPK